MNTLLGELELVSILPPSIAGDPQMIAVAGALDDQVNGDNGIVDLVQGALPWLPNLANLPERILDLLAWQFNVQFWDDALTRDQKVALIEGVIGFWRVQGTRAAVQSLCDIIFGAGNCTILEWFEVGGSGTPYTFTVTVLDSVPLDEAGVERLNVAIATAKNVRSWMYLAGSRSGSCTAGVGCASVGWRMVTSTAT